MTSRASWSILRHMTILGTVMALGCTSLAAADQRPGPTGPILFGPNDTPRCLKCHGMANFAFRDSVNAPLRNLTVPADSFALSVHGRLQCQQCHGDISQYPHEMAGPKVPVSCGTDCHATDSTGNAYSHASTVTAFQRSAHRKGLSSDPDGSPTCLTCHGGGNPHGVARAKQALPPAEKMALCISCHDDAALMNRHQVDPEAVASYRRSFHYKAIRFGESNTAVCQDCHTAHDILPADSAASSIAPGHIAQTCGQQQCHPGARMSFAMSGANHLSLRIAREPVLWWLEKFFLLLTAGTMAMLVVGIVLDIQRSFGWGVLFGKSLGRLGAGWRRVTARAPAVWRVARRVLLD